MREPGSPCYRHQKQKITEWHSISTKKTETGLHWKTSLGEKCPHGNEFFLVNGPFVRNTISSDFVHGDNHYHSPKFVRLGELWIDDSIPIEERDYAAFHECYEAELMKKGMDYEKAHDRAKAIEDEFRRINRPGE